MTWEQIKQTIQVLYPQYVGSGKLIDDTDDGSSPSQLSLLVNLVNNRISSYPVDFNFLQEIGTITLTGATTYDLRTLLPDLKSVSQLYNLDQYKDHQFLSNSEANITPLEGWTVRGNTLVFTGSTPTGTAKIQYKSKYLVKNSSGTRQQFFLADSDYSVLDDDDINFIVFGLGDFINWNSDTENQERKAEVKTWFKDAMVNLVLHNKSTKQLDSLL